MCLWLARTFMRCYCTNLFSSIYQRLLIFDSKRCSMYIVESFSQMIFTYFEYNNWDSLHKKSKRNDHSFNHVTSTVLVSYEDLKRHYELAKKERLSKVNKCKMKWKFNIILRIKPIVLTLIKQILPFG